MSSSLWHGYSQHPDSHPTRPWWRRVVTPISETSGWERHPDRHFVADEQDPALAQDWEEVLEATTPALERIDKERPVPSPPPKCGQVWVFPTAKGSPEITIHCVVGGKGRTLALDPGGLALYPASLYGSKIQPMFPFVAQFEDWPPEGAILVAGPGAPWSPPPKLDSSKS